MENIFFNEPCILGDELKFISDCFKKKHLSGNGYYSNLCNQWIRNNIKVKKSLLTPSCTDSLEMSALLLDIKIGDEIIMPSFTFVSTANAFVLRGAKIKFVDIRSDTMNINEKLIEAAITKKTKAIVVVHYAGVSCEMDYIIKLAKKYKIYVIEDAAQGILSYYKNKHLGSLGDIACFSFHDTKNCTCGEGGAITINNKKFIKYADIIHEKGTNRTEFLKKQTKKYTWLHLGSSFVLSEINASMLHYQFKNIKKIINKRILLWKLYYNNLKFLNLKEKIVFPCIPENCQINGHIFYLKLSSEEKKKKLQSFLLKNRIHAYSHYIPLHSSVAGKKYGCFVGKDIFTTKESKKLLRLPLYYSLSKEKVFKVIDCINAFVAKS